MKTQNITKWLFPAPLPPVVLNDERLSLPDRAILSVLIQLSKKEGYCFANNKHFAKNLGCSLATVSKSINKLHKLGYIPKNDPDPDNGGRRYRRTVRNDLYYKGETSKDGSSRVNVTIQPPTKKEHSNINNHENNNHLFKGNEKEIVEKRLQTIFGNKWKFYNTCKAKYNEEYSIFWNKKSTVDLIDLCTIFNNAYEKELLKIPSKKRFETAINAFELVIKHKPAFFNDVLPSTFLKFFDKVIAQEKFLKSLKYDLKHAASSDDYHGFF